MKPKIVHTNLDANESVFFSRELEHVKTKTYDKKYPQFKARLLFPVSRDAGSGAETITYTSYDQTGVAKIIANYADDLPRADVSGQQFSSPVKSLGISYGYSLQEIRAARQAGKPLETMKSNAAKRGSFQEENRIAWFGDAATGLPGFLTNVNVGTLTLPNDGTGSSTKLVNKTADQIIRDLNALTNKSHVDSLGVEVSDTVVLPLSTYTYIASTPRSIHSDETILQFFMKANPLVQGVEWANELKDAGGTGVDVMVAYTRDLEHLSLEVPQDFEQLPEQPRNLEWVIPCHMRTGGVIIYYPLSVTKAVGA